MVLTLNSTTAMNYNLVTIKHNTKTAKGVVSTLTP